MQWHLKEKSSFSHSDHIFILQNAGSWFESCLVLPNYKILELLSFLNQKKCQFLNAFSRPFNPFRLSNGHGILHRLFLPQIEPDFFSKPAIPECGGNVKLHSLHKASNLQAAVAYGNEIAFHWILLPYKN